MSIEDYWVDGESYHVEFLSNDGRCVNRELIVPMGTTEETIKQMIQKSFQNIKEIKSIDSMSDVFCAKEFPTIVYS